MRIVNTADVKAPAVCYVNVPQPMYVYHNNEEFIQNELNPCIKEKKIINVIKSFADYQTFIIKYNLNLTYDANNRYIDIRPYNVWIKTIDKFIPDYANIYGDIFYVKGENDEPIPTNGCYIQLFYLSATPTRHIMFTSSGIHTIGMTKWEPTAAIRENFRQEYQTRNSDKATYERKLNKILNKKIITVPYMKMVMSMFNPVSHCFLNPSKAAKVAFGPLVRESDREKLLETQAFRKALMQTLKTLFPDLPAKFREKIPPEQMAEYMIKAMGIAEDQEDVDKMLKVFEKMKEVGYEENMQVQNNVPLLPAPESMSNGSPIMESKQIPASAELTKEEAEKQLDILRDDTGSIDSYVMQEFEDEVTNE